MNTLLRYFLYSVAAVLVLFLLAGVLVSLFVDPNDYRDEISRTVEEQTGRQLTLEGDIDLSVFPCCSLQLGAVTLSNPAGWQQAEFLSLQNAAVGLQLLPLLLRQEVQVGAVELDGLTLNLVSRRDGSTNWDFSAADPAAETNDTGQAPAPDDFSIAGIRVTDATVTYRDEAGGRRYSPGGDFARDRHSR